MLAIQSRASCAGAIRRSARRSSGHHHARPVVASVAPKPRGGSDNNVRGKPLQAIKSPLDTVAIATAAVTEVSKAVREKGVDAFDADKTIVARGAGGEGLEGQVDQDGLPLVYDRKAIQAFWDSRPRELQQRWTEFLGLSVPFLTKVTQILLTGGLSGLQERDAEVAGDARVIMEKLGPTYVKAGQMMSVRPDIIGQRAMTELAKLQDSVPRFDSAVARQVLEEELGRPIEEVFEDFPAEPVAAASLAQVYRAKLRGSGDIVAVKVQRPRILETVSKDLYVLRRAAEVYQGLIDRFAPQQNTDYVALLNEWAVGFYTELDFLNEASNQIQMKELMKIVPDVYIPRVYRDLCSRRVLVTEWVDGVKLTQCSPEEIQSLIGIGQEAFLHQLLNIGFFHADPHPGNLLRLNDQSKGKLAMLDFGLMARLTKEDMDAMVSSVVHVANRDYEALIDDFISLKVLPLDTNRPLVEPMMGRVIGPYVSGGGGMQNAMKNYNVSGGGFQQMTSDMITAMRDVPFSIPPYFAILGRAVVVLEGIALVGNPNYRIVMESYPFVARKLLSDSAPAFQRSLAEILYSKGDGRLQSQRLAVLLNSAQGTVADSGAFIDFDTVPEDGISLAQALRFLLSDGARSLRERFLEPELVNGVDLLSRQVARRAFRSLQNAAPRPPAFLSFLPPPPQPLVPVLVPPPPSAAAAAAPPQAEESRASSGASGSGSGRGRDTTAARAASLASAAASQLRGARPVFVPAETALEAVAPKLTQAEELYAQSLTDLLSTTLGVDAGALLNSPSPAAVASLLLALAATGSLPGSETAPAQAVIGRLQALAAQGGAEPVTRSSAIPADQQGRNAQGKTGLAELSEALAALTDDERDTALTLARRVVEQLNGRLRERLRTLAPEGTPAAASAPAGRTAPVGAAMAR